jgi:hypothetical protein
MNSAAAAAVKVEVVVEDIDIEDVVPGPKPKPSKAKPAAVRKPAATKKKTMAGPLSSSASTTPLGRSVCDEHSFAKVEIAGFRGALLEWYHENQRALPWRLPYAVRSIRVDFFLRRHNSC